MDNRIVWVDYAKSIGIFFVVLAHTMLYEPLQNWIYVFHMPLFFFLSGFLFSFERHKEMKPFVLSRYRNLIIPYISFNIITYAIWVIVLRHVGHDGGSDISWWSPLVNALLGNGKQMVHDVPLWFLLCLFIVEALYFALYHKSNKRITVTLFFFFIGWAIYVFCPYRLPFSLGTACVAIVFYSLGQSVHTQKNLAPCNKPILLLSTFAITILVAYFNGRINMHTNFYSNYLLFFLGGISGIFMIMQICLWLSLIGSCKIIEIISRNTLTICSIHLIVFAFMKGIMVYLLQINPDILSNGIIGNLIFATICFTLSLIIAIIIDKYFPLLIGKQR